jgi:hypothetical protein
VASLLKISEPGAMEHLKISQWREHPPTWKADVDEFWMRIADE